MGKVINGKTEEQINAERLEANETQIASLTNNGQINGMQIKTQAEYDALPATKETDGVIYLIRG